MKHKSLLLALGRRLRATREASGLSVSDLARRAGVSRRYVTEAEAGRANLSLVKLAELAGAMGVALRTLCDLPLASGHAERIALVGLRGAGKSTVGRRLALEMEAPFIELDQRVEQNAGLTLSEIFNLHGEDAFHRLEGEALEQVLAGGERSVIATGGSIVASPKNFERLRATTTTVWLRASPEEHMQRVLAQGDRRPMRDRPRATDELAALLAVREPLYAQCAIEVDTSRRTIDEVVALVRAALTSESARQRSA